MGHSLSAPARAADLAAHELLLLEEGHCLRDQALDLCMQPGARESAYRATSLATLVQMVAAGVGITVLPASGAAIETRHARVRAVALAEARAGRTLRMAWRSRSPHTRVLRELAGVLRAAMAASDPA